MERATAQRLVEAAHQVCPYSRATNGTSPSKRRWSEAAPMRADSKIEDAPADIPHRYKANTI